jgi:hypothetical protein
MYTEHKYYYYYYYYYLLLLLLSLSPLCTVFTVRKPETNQVSRVYVDAAALCSQFVLHVKFFRP